MRGKNPKYLRPNRKRYEFIYQLNKEDTLLFPSKSISKTTGCKYPEEKDKAIIQRDIILEQLKIEIDARRNATEGKDEEIEIKNQKAINELQSKKREVRTEDNRKGIGQLLCKKKYEKLDNSDSNVIQPKGKSLKQLELEYAKKVAMAEVLDFKEGILRKKISDHKLYEGDSGLMKKHHRFLSYIYSTIERYTVNRNIILYHYDKIPCTITVLAKTLDISRTSLNDIIQDSIEEDWIYKKNNKNNKREYLIIPTKLRLNFWLIYCKRRYYKAKSSGLAKAIIALEVYENTLNF